LKIGQIVYIDIGADIAKVSRWGSPDVVSEVEVWKTTCGY